MSSMATRAAARPRAKVLATKVTGRITDWKGRFGWIQADQPIAHPDAAKRGGKIYLSQLDVESEISGIGAAVSFYVYADGSGLGAMNCGPVGGPVSRTIQKPPQPATKGASSALSHAGGAARQPAGPRKRASIAPISGVIKQWKGAFGWVVPLTPFKHPAYRGQIYLHAKDLGGIHPSQLHDGLSISFMVYEDVQGLGADSIKIEGAGSLAPTGLPRPGGNLAAALGGCGGGCGGLSFASRGSGALGVQSMLATAAAAASAMTTAMPPKANLPRERITVVATTGEVVEWKSSFGWLKPYDVIEHAAANKRGGRVYVSRKDLVGVSELHLGQQVQFHIFADSSGLGAEECAAF
eukprot:TRINITY_DN1546_c0_g1_i1.p1 TRINITY_DN1546_c0_g1~~TRINITY_DN1546_c0_g1_i1.p1  ORF type:complete len:352 (+),score=47.57 TRINITY_DN1546_c0_g1_i1:87-1142(+)